MTGLKLQSRARRIRLRGRRFRTPGWIALALLLTISPLLPAADSEAQRIALAPGANSRFGLVFVHGVTPDSNLPYANPTARYEKARASGTSFTRWPIYWHKIETSPGDYKFASQDEVADLDIRNGLEVNGIIMGTPEWAGVTTSEVRPGSPSLVGPHIASQSPSGATRLGAGSAFMAGSAGAVPLGLQLSPFRADGSINEENRWANFVYKTVKRYMPGGELAQQRGWAAGKGIRYWEMWNEPDFFWANGAAVFWEGGIQNYYRLLKVGYLAAKAADPQATVVFGGLQYWSDQYFFTKVLNEIISDPQAKANNYFFDVVPFHLYINPYNLLNIGQWAKDEMGKRGMSKQVWVNETNLPIWDDPGATGGVFCPGMQGTQDEQASYVIQASALGLVAAVDRIFLFQLYDDAVGTNENFGLVRNDGSIRPSYTAYQVAATYISNPISPKRVVLENGAVDTVSFLSAPHGKVTILWNTTGAARTVKLASSTPTAQLIDKAGKVVRVLTASGNQFTIDDLPGKVRYGQWRPDPNHPNGGTCEDNWSGMPGSPYILVERVNTELSSRINPLPATTTQSSFALSWTRLDIVGGNALYDVQYRVGKDGQWQDWRTGVAQTSDTFGPAQSGKTYYFRSRVVVGGMAEPYPDGDGDTVTTVKLYLTGKILDSRGRPVSQASLSASLPGVSAASTTLSDGTGNYSLEVPINGTYDVSVSKPGFGSLPPKSIDISTSISYDFMLPPKDDLIRNGGFELGVTNWITSGTVITQTFRHSGNWGATLSQSGAISQTVNITGANGLSTLSFFYRTPSPGLTDRFEVQITGNQSSTFVFPLSQNTWQQGWVDTSSFQGPTTVVFRFTGQNNLWLDEVGLGSTPHWTFLPLTPRGNQSGW